MSDGSLRASPWPARSSWLLFVTLVPALYLLGSCMRGSDDAADPPPETAAPVTSATNPGPSTTSDQAPDAVATAVLPPDGNPELLAEWGQLEVRDGRLVVRDGVTPYTLGSPLFSDYAHKLRTVSLPAGAAPAVYDPDDVFDFPVGTVITKTFYYPVADGAADGSRVLKAAVDPGELVDGVDLEEVRLVETRVLVRRDDGWQALPYVWNDDETEATLQRTGDMQQLTLVDGDRDEPFTYVVPDVNQCASCHATDHASGAIEPIGPKARHLVTDVDLGDGVEPQLDAWTRLGLLSGAPSAVDAPDAADWDDAEASIDDRARAYLDVNCAHCHSPSGAADTSGLFLETSTEPGLALGICKTPVAAGAGTGGRRFDIVPGRPDESILVHRMESTEPAVMMPELGRSLSHTEGVDLVAAWIETLTGEC